MVDLAPTTPEQRAGIYEDVRALISPGFLTHLVDIGGARFCLRSLDQGDWEVLRHRTSNVSERQWKSWTVATAVWLVDGVVVSDETGAVAWSLARMCEESPRSVLDMLYSVVNGLMRRVTRSTYLIEAFLYESESRRLWLTEGQAVLMRNTRGWRRFDNGILSLWTFFNQIEDRREIEERDWETAKFIASPHAPKAIKKLSARDKERDHERTRRRQRVQDQAYYEAVGLLERSSLKEGQTQKSSFRNRDDIRMAETEEELREVMRRWVAGIKDDHDLVVDNVKAKIKHDVEERKRQADKNRAALDQALAEEGFTRSQPLPLSGEAGQRFLDRMRARMPGASVVIEDNTHNRAYRKYIEKNPAVGDLHVDADGNIHSSRTVSADMLDILRKPEASSLQEKVEQRRPTAEFVDDPEDSS